MREVKRKLAETSNTIDASSLPITPSENNISNGTPDIGGPDLPLPTIEGGPLNISGGIVPR